MKNKQIYIVLALIILVIIGGYVVYTNQDGRNPALKKTITNLEEVDYLKVESENKVFVDDEITTITVTSWYDNRDDKFQLNSRSTINGEEIAQDYYRIGGTVYRKIGDEWKKDQVLSGDDRYNTLAAITRMNKVGEVTEENDEIGRYYRSEISQEDAQKIINSLFINKVLNATEDIQIQNAMTRWYIEEETNELQRDIRVIEAQIDGKEVRIVMQNTYREYNVPLEVIVPDEALRETSEEN